MSSLLFWIDASNIFSSGDALSTVFVNGLAASDAACHGTVGVPALMVDVPGNQFLRFDASDQEYLELPDTSYNWNWDGTAGFYFTMVALLPDVAGSSGYEHVFQFSVNGPCDTSGGAVALYRVGSSADGCFELFDTSGVSYLSGALPGFFANTGDGVAHVYAVAARNSAVTGNAVVDAYVDGGLVASVEGTQPLVANLYTPYGSIGWGGGSAGDVTALGAGVGAYTDMHVYEASAFNGPFSALDAELSSDGLRAKWGASMAGPPQWVHAQASGLPRSAHLGANAVTFALPSYLSDRMVDSYWIASNPFGSATLDPASNVLTVAGVYTNDPGLNATTYDVVVSASNASGGVSPSPETFTIEQAAGPWFVPSAPFPVAVGDSNAVVADVGGISVYDTSRLGLSSFYFWISSDPHSNATLVQDAADAAYVDLVVSGSNRGGAAYDVCVSASNELGEATPFPYVARITEKALLGSVTLSNATPAAFGLSNFFLSGYAQPYHYYLTVPDAYGAAAIVDDVLVLTGAGRDVTYAVSVGASNDAGTPLFDDATLTVTETAVMALTVWTLGTGIRSVTLGENVSAFGLSNYLYDDAGLGPDFYWVSSDPQSNATIDANGVLSIAGAYGPAGTYAVEVSASNAAGDVSPLVDSFAVTQAANEWTVAQSAAVSLGSDAYSTSLVGKIVDASGLGVADYLWVSADPQSNATLSAEGLLTIQGADRGLAYTVAVSASNGAGELAPAPFAVTVTEKALIGGVALSDATPVSYALPDYFLAGLGFDYFYVTSDPEASAVIAVDGRTLVVTGAYRGLGYVVEVGASNASGVVADVISLAVTEVAVVWTLGAGVRTASLGENVATFGLSNYLYDDAGLGPDFYWVSSDPQSNATIDANGVLSIAGAYGSVGTYAVEVSASNAAGAVSPLVDSFAVHQAATEWTVQSAAVSLGTDAYSASMTGKIVDASGLGVADYLWVSADPQSNAALSAEGVLTIQGADRGLTYVVDVSASNAVGEVAPVPFAITVTEKALLGAVNLIDATPTYFQLPDYFLSGLGFDFFYVTSDPRASSEILNGSTLVVTGAYRNATYTLTVGASNGSGVVADAISVVVTEAAPQPVVSAVPFTTATATYEIPLQVDLSQYFSDPLGDALFYWIVSNPLSNATMTNSSNLSVTWVATGSNATSAGVVVGASNAAGMYVTGTAVVLEPAAQPPTANAFSGPVTLSNVAVDYDLSGYFFDPQSSALSYWIASNPLGTATLSNNTLHVTAAYRASSNVSYGITVGASNAYGLAVLDVLAVVEAGSPPPVASAQLGAVTLSNGVAAYPLASYFSGAGYYYWVSSGGPYGNASLSSSNVLSVRGAWVGSNAVTYSVTVSASNAFGQTTTNVLAVTEAGTQAPADVAFGSVALSNNTASYALASYFTDPQGSNLFYWISANPRSNAALSNAALSNGVLLQVAGAYRGASYSVAVSASNVWGQYNTDTLLVTESAALSPVTNPLGSRVLSNATPVTYALTNYYFSDPQGSALTFWIASNPKSNAALSGPSGATLTVTGNYRGGAAYSVVVAASNALNMTSSNALVVTENPAASPSQTPAAVVHSYPASSLGAASSTLTGKDYGNGTYGSAQSGDGVGGAPAYATFTPSGAAPVFYAGLAGPSLGSVTLGCNAVAYGLSNYFKDPTVPPLGLSYWLAANPRSNAAISGNGVLSVTGAYRGGASYNVMARASNAWCLLSNAVTVTEPADPVTVSAFGAATLCNAAATFGLSNYFADAASTTLYYSLRSNPYANASLTAGGSVLSIAGNTYRNVTYAVTVAASNAFGYSNANTLTVTEPSDTVAATPTLQPLVSFGIEPVGQNLTAGGYVALRPTLVTNTPSASLCTITATGVTNTSSGPVQMYVTARWFQSSSSVNDQTIQWYTQNSTTNAVSQVCTGTNNSATNTSVGITLNVGEQLQIVSANGDGTKFLNNANHGTSGGLYTFYFVETPVSAAISNTTATFGLSNYFTDAAANPLYYSISSNANGNASISAGGVLSVVGSYRNASYNVTVAASNAFGCSNVSTMVIVEALDPIATSGMASATLSNNTAVYGLSNYFSDGVAGRTLYYSLRSNANSNASVSAGGVLSVVGNYRNVAYNVTVAASNAFGGSNVNTLAVTEVFNTPVVSGIGAVVSGTASSAPFVVTPSQTIANTGTLVWSVAPSSLSTYLNAGTGVLTFPLSTVITTTATTLKATNPSGLFATSSAFSLTVLQTPVITGTITVPANTDTSVGAYSTVAPTLSQTSAYTGAITWSVNPPSLSSYLNVSTGVLTIPMNTAVSSTTVTLTASGPTSLTATTSFNLTILPWTNPSFSATTATTSTDTATGPFTISAPTVAQNIAHTGTLTWSISPGTLASYLATSTGVLTFPIHTAVSSTSVTLTATGPTGEFVSETFTLTVIPWINPVLSTITPAAIYYTGPSAVTITPSQTASNTGTITWTLAPAGVSGYIDSSSGVITIPQNTAAIPTTTVTVTATGPTGEFASTSFGLTTTLWNTPAVTAIATQLGSTTSAAFVVTPAQTAASTGTITWTLSPVSGYINSSTGVITVPLGTSISAVTYTVTATGPTGLANSQAFSLTTAGLARAYPPAAMTANSTNIQSSAYGNGTYVTSASTYLNAQYPYNAFDGSSATEWDSTNNIYTGSVGGAYNGSQSTVDMQGTSHLGEWLQIQLPQTIVMSSYAVAPYASSFDVYGSTDGLRWTCVDSRRSVVWNGTTKTVYNLAVTPAAFTYYRFVTNANNVGATATGIYEWVIYGTEVAAMATPISIPPGCRGLYSLYLLSDAYAGPVANCRRSSDSVTTDVYLVNGQLCTSGAGTTSLSTWLGAATAYVATWYDQSSSGNHATMATAASQPSVNLSTMRVTFATSQYLSMPDGTIPYGNTTYTVTAKHLANVPTATGTILAGGTYNSTNQAFGMQYSSNGAYQNYWWANDFNVSAAAAGPYVAGNVVTFKYDQSTRYCYMNGSLVSSQASVGRSSTPGNNTIGVGNSPSQWLNGDLYYVAIFADALSDPARLAVEGLYSTTAPSPVLNFDGASLSTVGAGGAISSWANASGSLGATFAATAYNSPLAGAVTATSVAYPPFAMTANSCSPGVGTYVASASSSFNLQDPYLAFDNTTASLSAWAAATAGYTTGSYTGAASTNIGGTAYAGDWLQFKMPYPVASTSYSFITWTDAARCPTAWAVAGSVDGATWTLLDSKTGQTTAVSTTYTYATTASTAAYSYFRIAIGALAAVAGTTYATLTEFHVYAAPKRYHVGFVGANSQYFNITQSLPMTWFNNAGVYAGMTVFVVAQLTATTGVSWERLFDFGNAAPSDNILFNLFGMSTVMFQTFNGATYNGPTGTTYTGFDIASPDTTTFHVFVLNVTNAASGYTASIYLDGCTAASASGYATGSSATPIANRTTVNNYIGKSNWAADAYLSANVRQIEMFNSSLAAPDMAVAYRLLAAKWGMFNDGSTPQRAASSAAAIKALTGTNVNGYYWINGPPASSLTGLKYYWTFENNSVTDSVGGIALTATGAPTYATAGRIGNAAAFASNVSGVSTSQHLDGTMSNPTGNMTVGVWFYPLSLPGNGALSAITNMGSLRLLLAGTASGGATMSGWFCDQTASWTGINSTSLVQANSWNHAALAYSTTGQSLYLNGVLVGSATLAGALNSGATFVTVGWDTVATRGFQGYVDELALYGRALSASEVASLSGAPTLVYCGMN